MIEEYILKDISNLTTKIKNLDKFETGKTLFGERVTLSAEQYSNILNLAKKQVADVRKEHKASEENKQLKAQVSELMQHTASLETELNKYKKLATFSIKDIKEQDRSLKERENMKIKLNKALFFIDACGLSEEYQRYRLNNKNKTYDLE